MNENGTAYLQIDQNNALLSSGYEDIQADNQTAIASKFSEFMRFNPTQSNDSFVFVGKYDKE